MILFFFFFKQKTAYEMRISDWSSDVCSSDLIGFQPDDIEPPSDERAQPREQPMLEIGREAVDRAEQIVGQHRVISLARQQRGIGPIADADAVGRTALCRDRNGGLRGMGFGSAHRGTSLGREAGGPAERESAVKGKRGWGMV